MGKFRNLVNSKWFKILLYAAVFWLLLAALSTIIIGIVAKDHIILSIVSKASGTNFKTLIFVISLLTALSLAALLFFGLYVINNKETSWTYWLFTIVLALLSLAVIILGVIMIVIASNFANEIEAACTTPNSNFSRDLASIYTISSAYYCVTGLGCQWYVGPNYLTHDKGLGATNLKTSHSVTNTQEWSAFYSRAISVYGITFSTPEDTIDFLNYFGEIEKDFNCSGICNKETVFYFSDSSKGAPSKSCRGPIEEDLLKGEIIPLGIYYLLTGISMVCILILHLGLCFKKKVKNLETDSNTPEIQFVDRAIRYGPGMFGNLQMNKKVEEIDQVNSDRVFQQRTSTKGCLQPKEPKIWIWKD